MGVCFYLQSRLYREDLAVSGQPLAIHFSRFLRLYREDLAVSGQRIEKHMHRTRRLYREDLAVSGQLAIVTKHGAS